jgi:hypothetical protein
MDRPEGSTMYCPPRRRLTLKDTMLLVAATAVGVAWARAGWDWMYVSRTEKNLAIPPRWEPYDRAVRTVPALIPCVATCTVALLALRLSRPRQRMHRVVLQPGTAACIVAALGLIVGAVDFGSSTFWWWALKAERMPISRVAFHSMEYLFQATSRIAVALAAVWLILAASRRFRPEPSWIDRLGRVLGALWIAVAICRGWSELAQLMNDTSSSGLWPLLLKNLVRSQFSPLAR